MSTIPSCILLMTMPDTMSLLMTFIAVVIFIATVVINRISIIRIHQHSERVKDLSTIMQHTINTSQNYVIRLDLRTRLAENMHGDFLPEEGMSYSESLSYIHPEDRDYYTRFLKKLMGGAKTAECTFRWDMSRKAHKGLWRHIHDQGIGEYRNPKQKHPVNIYCTLTDITEQVEREEQEMELTDRYRKVFEQRLVGLAFYDKDGHLITANQKMRDILKFQSENDPYYYGNTLYDLPTFRDVMHNRQAEELYFCTKSVVVERGVNCYTELRVHPVNNEQGELAYITFSIRDITQERELYLKNRESDEEMRRQNKEIQQYETELQYLMDMVDMRFWRTDFEKRTITFYKGLSSAEKEMTFDEYQTYFVDDDGTIARNFANPEEHFQKPVAYLCHMKAIYHESDELHWNMLDIVPYFNEAGKLAGCYGVIRNVTDLIKKQEQLKKETEQANESGMKKSTFMANMTHEIRTPLNAIVGFSDVLPLLSTPEEKQEIVRVIMNNCDMLLRLVNDILAVSSLDNGGIDINPRETNFAKDFSDTATAMAQRVQPPVEFIAENPYTTLTTSIDSERIQQVVTNFVTNAVKYTHQGHIKIGYRQEQRHGKTGLYLFCEDTGAGIPKEDQQKVFERFVKLNDYVQGTGLGLSICKVIAEKCGGEIGVHSKGEGHGSTFWLWIPCDIINSENKTEV